MDGDHEPRAFESDPGPVLRLANRSLKVWLGQSGASSPTPPVSQSRAGGTPLAGLG